MLPSTSPRASVQVPSVQYTRPPHFEAREVVVVVCFVEEVVVVVCFVEEVVVVEEVVFFFFEKLLLFF